MNDTLLGSVATSLCVIAVALVGIAMMNGRLAIRDGVRVATACFVLFGAPLIASGLRDAADGFSPQLPPETPPISEKSHPAALPPASYDPHAGASLRVD